MDPAKVTAVMSWPPPKTIKELQSFLGMANYYNAYVASFATLATPLTNLLQGSCAWVWGPEQQRAFEDIKAALTSAPVLQLPRDDLNFEVVTDASDVGVGAVLQ